MNEHGPILVPLDGSELAEGALSIAVEVARAKRTHLVLLSVWEEPGSGTPTTMSMEMEERARDYFETYLGGIRDRLQDHRAVRRPLRLDTGGGAGARCADDRRWQPRALRHRSLAPRLDNQPPTT